MADNITSQILTTPWPVIVTDPATPASGDPVRVGNLTGIALNDEGAGGVPSAAHTMVDFGLYVAMHPVTDTIGGVALYDIVRYVDAGDRLENTATGTPYGIALAPVGNGATTVIPVMHAMGLGSGTLGAGSIATVNLAAGILSTDGAGRAKFAAAFFDAATVTAKFAVDTITGRELKTGVIKQTVQVGEDETATHQITCAGMAVGDEVVSVLVFTTAAAIATMAAHAGTHVAAAGKITTDTEVNNTNNQYLITWIDKT